ncbi:hypothetical protein SAMN05444487_12114 [Marininema mesophilum]|uniref:Uncharacterized protein n=1 Tax=Marininema mesophilum TaxID=1048340 RepID=A0A1H3CA97_9BACL|nr:hypothetical protein [Marininema mesophilum]SDX51006.1 hypothetical protein SAMN05444487_12114 [Marininema mesophilum]
METMKLSTLILTVSPDLYELLRDVELDSEVIVTNIQSINRDDLSEIISQAIEHHHCPPYH